MSPVIMATASHFPHQSEVGTAIQEAMLGIEKDLGKAAAEFLANDIVGKFLSDADNMTVAKINELIAKIEGEEIEIPADISDSDIQAIIEKLRGIRKEIAAKNPFEAMKNDFMEFKEAMSSGDLSKIAGGMENALGGIGEVFNSITKSLADMGVGADEATQDIISDIGGMLQGATDVAAGIASGNYLQAITGGVQLVTNAVKLWNDANRENAETIKAAEKRVKELEAAIKSMQNALARTYNSGRYDLQNQIIAALEEELAEEEKKLQAIRDDIDGNSSDYTEEDYQAQLQHIEELKEQITQAYEDLAEDLTQTTIPDIESEITDALINAFANGYSNADIDKEIAKLANKLMKNAAIEMLKTQYLADSVAEWYAAFKAAMEDGMLDEQEKADLQASFADATAAFREQLEALNEMFPDEEDVSTLSGALKGASQESIDLLAGYTNATRIIEQSQLDVLRQQLEHMASIDARTMQAVEALNNIYRRMNMTTTTVAIASSDDTAERAYGILDEMNL